MALFIECLWQSSTVSYALISQVSTTELNRLYIDNKYDLYISSFEHHIRRNLRLPTSRKTKNRVLLRTGLYTIIARV